MYCGIKLSGDADTACAIAFLDDSGVECFSETDDDALIGLLQDKHPAVIALNTPPEPDKDQGFREKEQELVDEGFAMLPQEMRDRKLLERGAYLTTRIQSSRIGAQIIESNPELVQRTLHIASDDDLADFGLETEDIHSIDEFDATTLALMAKLYDDEQYVDKDLIIPKNDERRQVDDQVLKLEPGE